MNRNNDWSAKLQNEFPFMQQTGIKKIIVVKINPLKIQLLI
ncbi:hypothetical protein U1299_06960 [Enterococcus cecorum]|uniref:Uncharacterized protein n=1 Tax=Enterococcus cecorum TaxID=44008 RepID=A0AAW9JSJ2_9ENTE|nr:hypothetical protein [Enterococcus cecorum]MDZ5504374.1 hypothetical protein [Enterococcus cecorum]MDZ5531775.1 hypothetical protein [Enterococcus cecorum]MDZ5545307.1 hypothetical protein [Enterococcus cecorum]MDZ5550115.1 hypothetical protein [Enterococcus cecorum]MDZ5552157.1 hypothetical protein [Enterococcus cecorum]